MLREFPCKLFHTTGNCVNGDECMFSHDALSDDTQDLLNKVRSSDTDPILSATCLALAVNSVTLSFKGLKNVFYEFWTYIQVL